jgi:hypothetical protein
MVGESPEFRHRQNPESREPDKDEVNQETQKETVIETAPEKTEHTLIIERFHKEQRAWESTINELSGIGSKREAKDPTKEHAKQTFGTIEEVEQQTNELKSQVYALTSERKEKLEQAQKTLIQQLKELELNSERDISKLHTLVSQIKTMVVESHQVLDNMGQLNKQSSSLHIENNELLELGIDDWLLTNEDELELQISELNTQIDQLNKRRFSRIRQRVGPDRKEKQELELQKQKLRSLINIENSKRGFRTLEMETELHHLVHDTNEVLWEKLKTFYESQIAQRAEELPETENPLAPVVLESLDNTYIEQEFIPHLEQEIARQEQQYDNPDQGVIAELRNPSNQALAIEAVKRAFALDPGIVPMSDDPDRFFNEHEGKSGEYHHMDENSIMAQRVRDFNEAMAQLPDAIKKSTSDFIGQNMAETRMATHSKFQSLARFALRAPERLERLELTQCYANSAKQLSSVLSNRTAHEVGLSREQVERTAQTLQIASPVTDKENTFIDKLDAQQWRVLANDETARDTLRKGNQDRLEQAHRVLNELIVKRLYYKERDSGTNRLMQDSQAVERLLQLKDVAYAPQALLVAYREQNHSAQDPHHAFREYIASLDINEIERRVASGEPGFTNELVDIVKLVQEKPETYNKNKIDNPELLEFEEQLKNDEELLDTVPAFFGDDVIVIIDSGQTQRTEQGDTQVYQTTEEELRSFAPDLPKNLPRKIPRDDPLFTHIKRTTAKNYFKKDIRIVQADRAEPGFSTDPFVKHRYEIPEELAEHLLKKHGRATDLMSPEKSKIDNPDYLKIQQALANIAADLLQDQEAQAFALSIIERLVVAEFDESVYQKLAQTFKSTSRKDIQEAIATTVSERAKTIRQDTRAFELLLEQADVLPEDSYRRVQMVDMAQQCFLALALREQVSEQTITGMSKLFNISTESLNNTLEFVRVLRNDTHHTMEAGRFGDYVQLAENKELLPFLQELSKYGYSFSFDHVNCYPELLRRKEEILTDIKFLSEQARKLNFVYTYSIPYDYQDPERGYVTEPFEAFIKKDGIRQLVTVIRENPELMLTEHFTSGLARALRNSDSVLREIPEEERIVPEGYQERFSQAMIQLFSEIGNPKSPLRGHEEFFTNHYALQFIARQPERIQEVLSLPEECPYLFGTLLQEGGPLYTNSDNISRDIFENGNAIGRAIDTEATFREKIPKWKHLYLYTDRRIGEQLANADTAYPITEIPKIKVNKGTALDHEGLDTGRTARFSFTQDFSFVTKPIHEMSIKEKRAVANLENLDDEQVESLTEIPFGQLRGMFKKMVFGHRLSQTIELSRALGQKKYADQRNRKFVANQRELTLQQGMYLHGSAIDNIENILLNGNLPQEALGESAGTDAYPFQVDFTRLHEEFINQQKTTRNIISNSLSSGYGHGGEHGVGGGIYYIYEREQSAYAGDTEYSAVNERGEKSQHALVLGGYPGTEINGIALQEPEQSLEKAKTAVLENGFYIPIYRLDGDLLLTQEEYDSAVRNLNLEVPVEVWDFSLKTGEQLGSNPGGEFTIPEETGPEKHYVKFGERGTQEEIQMWTEVISDKIYKECNIPVPDSKIVNVEGAYGRASKMFEINEDATPDFSKGFLVDLITQNYWDMNENNAKVDQNGETQRLDNGAAFPEYRGTLSVGGKPLEFDLEKLIDDAQNSKFPTPYSEIAGEELERQAKDIVQNLTPEAVNTIVNGARLPQEVRTKLEADINQRVEIVKQKFNP